jgi:hypothetical protein
MNDLMHNPVPGWHYGLDPLVEGLAVRRMERLHHRLGDALRLELLDPAEADPDLVHLQWFIATRAGPWALWTACRPDEVAAREAVLAEVTWFGPEAVGEPLAGIAR